LSGVEGRKHHTLNKDCANPPSSVHPERSLRTLRVNGDCTHQTHRNDVLALIFTASGHFQQF
ncbi:hypothetical protein, partial [Endozoicomonas sp. YOMI1]|uniref:hypothetical protein n=1 Tax=Endozoicomonas sp. YOMI1 TaxID=2828739 RepID=UPI0021472B74